MFDSAVELSASDEERNLLLNGKRCETCKLNKPLCEFYPYARGNRRAACIPCERKRDALRGSAARRGYGRDHQAKREEWRPIVESGEVICWRCNRRIHSRAKWDLGHDDMDKSKYKGPEHRACNRQTKTHEAERQRDTNTSEWWTQ